MLELCLVAALALGQGDDDAASPSGSEIEGTYDYAFAHTLMVDVGGGATRVTTVSQYPTPSYGYFPVIFHVDNTMGPRQTLKLSYTASGVSGSKQFSRSVEVAQGERRTVSIPVPTQLRSGLVHVRGPGITEKGDASIYFNPVNARQRAVLNLGTEKTFEQGSRAKPSSYTGNANVQVVTVAPEEAPAELAPYVGWDAVVVTGVRFEQLSEAQRRALEEYAALGGHLVLMQAPRGITSSFPLLARDEERYGIGELTFCEKCGVGKVLEHVARVPVRAIEPKGRRNRYGYGYDAENIPELELPVAMAPIGRFLFIITLFTLAIGPGSLWVARRKGPAALLITIPGTAAITCAFIVGYSVLRDGFTVHSMVQGFTLLDSANHRAISSSVGAFYANLAPGHARFAPEELVVAPPGREYGSLDQGASIVWDNGANFGADLVPSRSYIEWSFLSAAPTRARLVVKQQGDQVDIQNALGAECTFVSVRAGGKLYSVTSLKEGETKRAVSRDAVSALQLGSLEKRVSDAMRAVITAPVREGEFIAAMDGPGFTPLGGLALEHNDSRHLVRGGYEQ